MLKMAYRIIPEMDECPIKASQERDSFVSLYTFPICNNALIKLNMHMRAGILLYKFRESLFYLVYRDR